MPEYLAPGVYLEETSFRARSIEGVSTSTAGFIGPTRWGPVAGKPEVLTSFADFQRTYGGLDDLAIEPATNYVAHAARAFFDEGGARLYIARVMGTGAERASITRNGLTVRARHVGAGGEARVTFRLIVGGDVRTTTDAGTPTLTRTRNGASVVVTFDDGGDPDPVRVVCRADVDADGEWTVVDGGGTRHDLDDVLQVFPLAVQVDVAMPSIDDRGLAGFDRPATYGPASLGTTGRDSIWRLFGDDAGGEPPVVLELTGTPDVDTLTDVLYPMGSPLGGAHWLIATSPISEPLDAPTAPEPVTLVLVDGSDGDPPTADHYAGDADELTGFTAFAAIEDISIVAAPGSTELEEGASIRNRLIGHCHAMRYRVAVLDTPSGATVNEARDWRNQTSSTHAAIYYPWVLVDDPNGAGRLALPPSGFVAGVWARNDINRAVFKAPANEVVRSIVDLERRLTKGQQEVLNPEGVNCLRFFAGRGNLVWGARTMTDDPEWKYVSVRRYFAYLERSIERSTQWAVFEPNGDALWANVRRSIEDFLLNEWKSGALLGTEPKQAYFVRCDRSTMTQNDLDNGRLVCLIGVAVVKPAEFVIFRIGQWTAAAG
jgi:phage tail sheath protein FI